MNRSSLYIFQIIVGLSFCVKVLKAEELRDHNITLDDYFTLAYLPESVISPDGQYVAYADARWQESPMTGRPTFGWSEPPPPRSAG